LSQALGKWVSSKTVSKITGCNYLLNACLDLESGKMNVHTAVPEMRASKRLARKIKFGPVKN
jgi:hypothetical protein